MGAEYTQQGKGCLFLCVDVGRADSSRHISAPLQDPAAFPAVMWCEYLADFCILKLVVFVLIKQVMFAGAGVEMCRLTNITSAVSG